MSKSLGNFVGVNEPPTDMFGKLMSISDKLMARYYEVLLGRELSKGADPFEAKKQLAFEIVQTYHSAEVAQRTLTDWNARFSKKRLDEAELPAIPAMADGSMKADTADYAKAFALKKSREELTILKK